MGMGVASRRGVPERQAALRPDVAGGQGRGETSRRRDGEHPRSSGAMARIRGYRGRGGVRRGCVIAASDGRERDLYQFQLQQLCPLRYAAQPDGHLRGRRWWWRRRAGLRANGQPANAQPGTDIDDQRQLQQRADRLHVVPWLYQCRGDLRRHRRRGRQSVTYTVTRNQQQPGPAPRPPSPSPGINPAR